MDRRLNHDEISRAIENPAFKAHVRRQAVARLGILILAAAAGVFFVVDVVSAMSTVARSDDNELPSGFLIRVLLDLLGLALVGVGARAVDVVLRRRLLKRLQQVSRRASPREGLISDIAVHRKRRSDRGRSRSRP